MVMQRLAALGSCLIVACTQLQHAAGEGAREDGGSEASAIERNPREAGASATAGTDGGAVLRSASDAATPHHGGAHAIVDAGDGSVSWDAGNDSAAALV